MRGWCSSLPALKSNAVISPSAISSSPAAAHTAKFSVSVSCCPEEVSDWCGAASVDSLVTLADLILLQAEELVSLTCQSSGRGKPGLIVQWWLQDKSSLSSGLYNSSSVTWNSIAHWPQRMFPWRVSKTWILDMMAEPEGDKPDGQCWSMMRAHLPTLWPVRVGAHTRKR